MTSKRFVLYSRSYCHLCDDMHQALRDLCAACGEQLSIEVVDVDLHPELLERYDELVPVLMGVDEGQPPQQLCNYFLNENKVRTFLTR